MGKACVVSLFFGLAGCRGGQDPRPAAEARAEAPPPPPEPVARRVEQEVGIATFRGDELEECVAVQRVFTIPGDSAFSPAALDTQEFVDRAGAVEGVEIVPLTQTCDQQFGGRPALASCAIRRPAQHPEGHPEVTMEGSIVSLMYSFALALADDGVMRDCMRDGGRWESIPHDSHEFRRAELDYEMAKLRARRGR